MEIKKTVKSELTTEKLQKMFSNQEDEGTEKARLEFWYLAKLVNSDKFSQMAPEWRKAITGYMKTASKGYYITCKQELVEYLKSKGFIKNAQQS